MLGLSKAPDITQSNSFIKEPLINEGESKIIEYVEIKMHTAIKIVRDSISCSSAPNN